MTSLLKFDLENCEHRALISFPIVSGNKFDKKDFLISLFHQATSGDPVKITIVNVHSICEHYTCVISRQDFGDIKKSQNLLIDFDSLLKQLKTLIIQCEGQNLNIKLKIGDIMELVFYTMSDVKELVIMSIPVVRTSLEELVVFMQKRNDIMEAQCRTYIEHTNKLQQQYTSAMDALQKTYDQIKELKEKCARYEQDAENFEKNLNNSETKNISLQQELALTKNQNSELRSLNNKLRSDVELLKIGNDYYLSKSSHLESIIDKKEASSVPREKYEKLSHALSSALADLLKCQTDLKNTSLQQQFLKTANSELIGKMSHYKVIIDDLKAELKKHENFETPTENFDELIQMIEKLESKATDSNLKAVDNKNHK